MGFATAVERMNYHYLISRIWSVALIRGLKASSGWTYFATSISPARDNRYSADLEDCTDCQQAFAVQRVGRLSSFTFHRARRWGEVVCGLCGRQLVHRSVRWIGFSLDADWSKYRRWAWHVRLVFQGFSVEDDIKLDLTVIVYFIDLVDIALYNCPALACIVSSCH